MGKLSGSEFVDGYIVPQLFNGQIDPIQKMKIVKSWDLILSHIENFLTISTDTYVISTPPALPTAAATAMTVSFNNGTGLKNTGAILAALFVQEILIPNKVPNTAEVTINLTNNFNALFEHIVGNLESVISNIKYDGIVTTGSGPMKFNATSVIPVMGKTREYYAEYEINSNGDKIIKSTGKTKDETFFKDIVPTGNYVLADNNEFQIGDKIKYYKNGKRLSDEEINKMEEEA